MRLLGLVLQCRHLLRDGFHLFDYGGDILTGWELERTIHEGVDVTVSCWRDPEVTGQLSKMAVAHAARLAAEMVEPLSEREIEVLSLIAEGLSNRQVAQRLVISVNTVRVHTSNIYGKLGVSNRTQAVTKARGLGILRSQS